jgi:putative alpha-1,2-mannosidase
LDDYGINVELTATPRAGFHRYTYPQSDESGILIDLGHGIGDQTTESYIRVVDSNTIVGMRRSSGFIRDHRYYFCARFSKPISSIKSFEDGVVGTKSEVFGKVAKLLIQFRTSADEEVLIKVGLSTASEEGAVKNLDAEITGWDFEKTWNQTRDVWNQYLQKMEIEPRDEGQKISFYTSLYHALLMPNLVTDIDGSLFWMGS